MQEVGRALFYKGNRMLEEIFLQLQRRHTGNKLQELPNQNLGFTKINLMQVCRKVFSREMAIVYLKSTGWIHRSIMLSVCVVLQDLHQRRHDDTMTVVECPYDADRKVLIAFCLHEGLLN